MKITQIQLKPLKESTSSLKATCNLVIDESLVIHDVKVITGKNGTFVAMPSIKLKDGTFANVVHPINKETRELIQSKILEVYNKEIQKSE